MTNKTKGARITTGKYKNRYLSVAPNTRPVTERLKHKIFGLLGERILHATCLDIFAGSGSFGFEAISRGAAFCAFVEKGKKAFTLLQQNAEELHLAQQTYKIVKKDYASYAKQNKSSYQIIFADPPYPRFNDTKFNVIAKALTPGGVLVVKAPIDEQNKTLSELPLQHYEEHVGKHKLFFLMK